jgi:tRNA A37 N6-isopentenylltransferase MiaA
MPLIIALVLVLAMMGGGGFYINHLNEQLATSQANNIKLEQGIDSQKQVIEQLQQDVKHIQQINTELSAQNEKHRKDANDLRARFSSRDLGVFITTEPEKAQGVINAATQRALRCLELATGAELNERERNAATPQEANRECPSFIPSR